MVGFTFLSSDRPNAGVADAIRLIKHEGMLAELYVEALLADEMAADEVWALWDAGVIADDLAAWAWQLIAA